MNYRVGHCKWATPPVNSQRSPDHRSNNDPVRKQRSRGGALWGVLPASSVVGALEEHGSKTYDFLYLPRHIFDVHPDSRESILEVFASRFTVLYQKFKIC